MKFLTKSKNFIVPKNAKEETFWALLLSSWLQKIQITKEKALRRHQNISVIESRNAEKKLVKPILLSFLLTTKALAPFQFFGIVRFFFNRQKC